MIRTLSWGCGVQSTLLGELSARGDLPRLDVIITADTQFERRRTYEIRDFYMSRWRKMGMDVRVVTAGSVRKQGAEEHIHIPFWTDTGGPLQRQCTKEFKIVPIKWELRTILGYPLGKPPHPPPGSVEMWIGFTLDEYERVKDSRLQYIRHRWPFIEQGITRNDCIKWFEDRRLPVPVKSACICCPYRLPSDWLDMQGGDEQDYEEAIAFDEEHRDNPLAERGESTADQLYIYKYVVPLKDADLPQDAARERKAKQLPLVTCEGGYCWV
jgi:hypothetical protein